MRLPVSAAESYLRAVPSRFSPERFGIALRVIVRQPIVALRKLPRTRGNMRRWERRMIGMTEAVGERSLPIGALIAAAGGAVAAVGAVLPWESISILGVSESDSGLTSNPGKIIAILGAVPIGLALAWIM